MIKTLLARIESSPVLSAIEQQPLFESCLKALISDPKAEEVAAEAYAFSNDDDDYWPEDGDDSWIASLRPYRVVDGILHIPVMGVLLNRFPYAFGSYATGYEYIRRAHARGEADGNVRGHALVCDSPGGMVAGCFETVELLAAGTKPMRAFASDHAYSAAYALAVAADSISVSRSGGVGSIGVVTSHVDYSGALDQAGVKITFLFKGKHKVDGNPYESLSKQAKDRIDARLEKLYGIFVSTVATNRDMDEEAVRATEAATYDAEEAIQVGLADRIEEIDDGLVDFAATLSEEDQMANQGQDTGKKFDDSEMANAVAAGRAEGVKEGQKAEQARMAAILTCPNAAGREAAAIEMALDTETSFSATTADKHLARLPKAAAGKQEEKAEEKTVDKGGDHFSAHMDKDKHPEAGKGAKPGDKAEGEKAEGGDASVILSNYRSVTGATAPKQPA